MAHPEQKEFIIKVRERFLSYFIGRKVLEIGSLDINGTVRDYFTDCDYLGIDLGPGPGVDQVVESGHLFDSNELYDVTISTECFEHNPYWKETFANMIELTQPSGLVIFTCAAPGRKEHGTKRSQPGTSPFTLKWNYYQNLSEKDFRKYFDFNELFEMYRFEENTKAKDLYFYGIRNSNSNQIWEI